jgi:hypothetical protein
VHNLFRQNLLEFVPDGYSFPGLHRDLVQLSENKALPKYRVGMEDGKTMTLICKHVIAVILLISCLAAHGSNL